jgi:hypothetical protein
MLTITGRIGCFLLILGAAGVAIFLASDLAHAFSPEYLFWGVILLLAGFTLWRRGRRPAAPSGRFRLLRSLRQGDRTGNNDLPSS